VQCVCKHYRRLIDHRHRRPRRWFHHAFNACHFITRQYAAIRQAVYAFVCGRRLLLTFCSTTSRSPLLAVGFDHFPPLASHRLRVNITFIHCPGRQIYPVGVVWEYSASDVVYLRHGVIITTADRQYASSYVTDHVVKYHGRREISSSSFAAITPTVASCNIASPA